MKNTCFTVASSKAEKISAILIFLLVCVPFSIAGLVILDKLIMRIICICLFVLGVFVVLSSFLICLSIEDNILKGRTMTARRFEFDLSEIKKIRCSAMKSKDSLPGSGYFIRLNSDMRNIKVTHGMACFEKLAEYIIEKYDDNTINKEVIDEQGINSLRDYITAWNNKNK